MPRRTPKVTVLALAYNHARYLAETLDSLRTQSFQDFELFVSDDASTDDSAQRIKGWNAEHGRIDRLFLHNQNRGLCATLNELLADANGEYLQLLACDDHLLPDGLADRVIALDNSGTDVAAVYTDALLMNDRSEVFPERFLDRFLKRGSAPTGDLFSGLLRGNFLPAMSVLSRRRYVQEVGGFDEQLQYEDWDLWLRLSRLYDFRYVNQPSVRYRLHDANLHTRIREAARQSYRILTKHRDVLGARLRILRTLSRNASEFPPDSPERINFLTWADDYPETRWFARVFFDRGFVSQHAVFQFVKTAESCVRPFSRARPGKAA